jgi:rhamnose utilization protein RhaD (predicted bifunctional aldolase and dehydrogenase)
MASDSILQALVAMSNHLGDPANDYSIMGEGNTSARADATTFWVKTSGYELRTMKADGFVRCAFDGILPLLNRSDVTDEIVKNELATSRVDPSATGHPSVEALLHALCLQLEGINFVGHTHPTAINAIACSVGFDSAFKGRIFPDEIVVCGPAPLLIPYTDPGVPLARRIKQGIDQHADTYGELPRVILMQNHGMIALGRNPVHVENLTAMMVKTARILLGTFAAGGPRFLAHADVDRIHTRPDEARRRQHLKLE